MLTFQNYAGRKKIHDSIQIAHDNGGGRDYKIYYNKGSINPLDEYDDPLEVVSRMVDKSAQKLHIPLPIKQLDNLDIDIVSDEVPSNKYSRHVYNDVKNDLAYSSGRVYDEPDANITVIPRNDPCNNDRIYISGQSGSGKSTWAATYALNYIIEKPGNDVVLLSVKDYDPAFKRIPGLIKPKIDRQFVRSLDQPNSLDNYKNSFIIFDDFEAIDDNKLLNSIIKFKDKCFKLGRAKDITICSIQHKTLGGWQSMVDLNEQNVLVFFPNSNLNETKNLLRRYCSLSPNQVTNVLTSINEHNDPDAPDQVNWACILRPQNILITNTFIKIIDR